MEEQVNPTLGDGNTLELYKTKSADGTYNVNGLNSLILSWAG